MIEHNNTIKIESQKVFATFVKLKILFLKIYDL